MAEYPKVRYIHTDYEPAGWFEDEPNPTHKVVPLDALVIEKDENGEWSPLVLGQRVAGGAADRYRRSERTTGCSRCGAEGDDMTMRTEALRLMEDAQKRAVHAEIRMTMMEGAGRDIGEYVEGTTVADGYAEQVLDALLTKFRLVRKDAPSITVHAEQGPR